jgi:hypothetical protein
MDLIVENGTGIYGANAYAGRGYVRDYLTARNRATAWNAATDAQRDAAIIAATDYIDRRFGQLFLGQKQFTDLTIYASNILQIRALPSDGDTVTIGTVTYTFRTAPAVANDVAIGTTVAEAAGALVAAMAGTGGGSGTVAHPSASGDALSASGDVIVRALVGVLASPISTSSSSTDLVWDSDELYGGSDAAEQTLEFPRLYLYSATGLSLSGIPDVLKKATAEYAERALSAALMPDPSYGSSGAQVARVYEKVGPIEVETEYASDGSITVTQKYPAADKLLMSLISSNGGVIR